VTSRITQGRIASPPRTDARVAVTTQHPNAVSKVDTLVLRNVPLLPDGRTAPLPITLPADVQGVVVTAVASRASSVVVERFVAPGGKVLVDAKPASPRVPIDPKLIDGGPAASPNPVLVGLMKGTGTALLPNNPSVTLRGGNAQVVVRAADDGPGGKLTPAKGTVDVTVQIKRAPDVKKGRLPLTFYFTGQNGLSASAAPNSPVFKATMKALTAQYQQAGIEIGPVQYVDLPPALGRDPVPLTKLLAQGQPQRGVGVYFVDQSPVGGVAMSSALPGPAAGAGMPAGVVVGTRALRLQVPPVAAGEELARDVGHELGHFLGLFHTRELDGGLRDPFADTADGDRHNPMFPMDGQPGNFSRAQAEVLRRHPAVEIVR
jgi:hypothetical protein